MEGGRVKRGDAKGIKNKEWLNININIEDEVGKKTY